MSILLLLASSVGLIICLHFKDYRKSCRHSWLLFCWIIASAIFGIACLGTRLTEKPPPAASDKKESVAKTSAADKKTETTEESPDYKMSYLGYGLLTTSSLGLAFYIFNLKKIEFLLLALGTFSNGLVISLNGEMPSFSLAAYIKTTNEPLAVDHSPPDKVVPPTPQKSLGRWPLLGDWIPIKELGGWPLYSPGDVLIFFGLMVLFWQPHHCQQKG